MRDIRPDERGTRHNPNNKCSRRDELLMIRHSRCIEQSDVGRAAIGYPWVLKLILENRSLKRKLAEKRIREAGK